RIGFDSDWVTLLSHQGDFLYLGEEHYSGGLHYQTGYRSSDFGLHWDSIRTPGDAIASNDSILLIAGENGTWLSRNHGTTINKIVDCSSSAIAVSDRTILVSCGDGVH